MGRFRLAMFAGQRVYGNAKDAFPAHVLSCLMRELRWLAIHSDSDTRGRHVVAMAYANAIPNRDLQAVLAGLVTSAPDQAVAHDWLVTVQSGRDPGRFPPKDPAMVAQLCFAYLTLLRFSFFRNGLADFYGLSAESSVPLNVLSQALPRRIRKVMGDWIWADYKDGWTPMAELERKHPEVYDALRTLIDQRET